MLLFDPWPVVIVHCDAAVLFRQLLASEADNKPPQPLTVAPFIILAKH